MAHWIVLSDGFDRYAKVAGKAVFVGPDDSPPVPADATAAWRAVLDKQAELLEGLKDHPEEAP